MPSNHPTDAQVVENLNKYLSNHLATKHGLTNGNDLITLDYLEIEKPEDKPKGFLSRFWSSNETGKKVPLFMFYHEGFPQDDSLIQSGFFDLGKGKTLRPLGFYSAKFKYTDAPLKDLVQVKRCQENLDKSITELAEAQECGYDLVIQMAKRQVQAHKESLAEANQSLLDAKALTASRRLKSPALRQILPAIYEATGILPEIGNSNKGFCTANSQSLRALVPYNDDMRVKQVSLNKQIIDLHKHAEEIANENPENQINLTKSENILTLAEKLTEISELFFLDYQSLKDNKSELQKRYDEFKKEFKSAIESTENIDLERGNTRSLVHIALFTVMGLGGLTACIDYGYKAITGKPAFGFRTTTRATVEQLEKISDSEMQSVIAATCA